MNPRSLSPSDLWPLSFSRAVGSSVYRASPSVPNPRVHSLVLKRHRKEKVAKLQNGGDGGVRTSERGRGLADILEAVKGSSLLKKSGSLHSCNCSHTLNNISPAHACLELNIAHLIDFASPLSPYMRGPRVWQ